MKAKLGPYKKNGDRIISIKLDKFDTWNLDETFSLLAVPLLKQLKETKHGGPLVDDEDVPDHLRSSAAPPKENEWDTDAYWFDRWDWVMDEMIWAHEQIADNSGEEKFFDYSEVKENTGIAEQMMALKVDEEGLKQYQDRIKNGLRLFGKYYRGLWD